MKCLSRFAVPVLLPVVLLCCQNAGEKRAALAERHCSSCHAFPDPSLLDKKTWQASTLPEMAFRMGLTMKKLQTGDANELRNILSALPAEPLITEQEWNAIQQYYLENAPDSLIADPAPKTYDRLTKFVPVPVSLPVATKNLLTLVAFDSTVGHLLIGTRKGNLYELDRALRPLDSTDIGSPPSDIIVQAGTRIVSCMGIMDPNDVSAGSIVQVDNNKNTFVTLADSLKRPVHIQQADMNNDGREDLVVSAFGNFTGNLSVLENTPEGYQEHIVHYLPGTRKTIVRDFNGDGLTDILALITQGDEHLALLTNRGKFRFSIRILLRFPPVYGSSFFEIADFNNDGNFDILYTNGDNADFSIVLKPYHGIRIFLNDGRNGFDESWFHPMHGASMARAYDYDHDGDLDIAAISFFPDFINHPDRSFIYFENEGGTYSPSTTTLAASSRWITMENADIDADGDVDIVLASLAFAFDVPRESSAAWDRNKRSLLVLKNSLYDPK